MSTSIGLTGHEVKFLSVSLFECDRILIVIPLSSKGNGKFKNFVFVICVSHGVSNFTCLMVRRQHTLFSASLTGTKRKHERYYILDEHK